MRADAAARICSEDVDDEPDQDTGRITGVPLDMDADCEFDEVEFGDGNQSHHIYSHMSGINITWYPREEDVMQGFFDELCDMFGLKYNDFWVTYQGRPCQPNTLAYSLPHGAWMSINFRCHGGGKKVIKTIVKSKTTENTVDADRPVYEKAFMNAVELHKAAHLNFKEMIKTMSLKQLETLHNFILHNKSTNDKNELSA
jgi:hypothetical protein